MIRIRDPIHGFVELPDEFAGVVNCWPLQRLRGIRQLALASLVYPGALHTRFDHTLGVAHAARLMATAPSIGLDPGELRLVTLAALLHDVGHGPFSHVSEYSLQRFADPAKVPAGQKLDKIHELVTEGVIRTDPELTACLPDDDERERVVTLLRTGYGRR